jgi:hypothetical protein
MGTLNISIIQGETKNFDFEYQGATENDKVWFNVYNGRDVVIYKASEKEGGSSEEIEIVTTGVKKYVVKVKSNESEKLWLNNVTYKLFRINSNQEVEVIYSGVVNVSSQQQQQEGPIYLGTKEIEVWSELPDAQNFDEGDIISVNGELKIKKNDSWESLSAIKRRALIECNFASGTYSILEDEIGIDIRTIQVFTSPELGLGYLSFALNNVQDLLLSSVEARDLIHSCLQRENPNNYVVIVKSKIDASNYIHLLAL